MSRRRVLLVSYWFPPSGGSGVQRATKLARYLPDFGWDVDVLTVKDVSYYVHDPALLEQLPGGVRVTRAGSLDPARLHRLYTRLRGAREPAPVEAGSSSVSFYRSALRMLFVPDPQVMWVPFAVARGRRGERPDAILSSSPPMANHVTAARLSRKLGLPLVVDFRDAWTQDPYLRMPTPAHRALQRRLERSVLGRAAHVTAISERIRAGFVEANPSLGADRTSVIPNGFDPSDFEGESARDEGPTIKYVGSLHAHHRAPLETFLRAFAEARRDHPDLRFRTVGAVDSTLLPLLQTAEAVELAGYVPHRDAVAEARAATALLLLVDFAPGNETTVTGKVYDYLGARRPIALVGPEGDAADVVRQAGAGERFGADDVTKLAAHLRELVRGSGEFEPAGVDRFSRVRHAEEFARILDKSVARNG